MTTMLLAPTNRVDRHGVRITPEVIRRWPAIIVNEEAVVFDFSNGCHTDHFRILTILSF